jgi:hypothetical protein
VPEVPKGPLPDNVPTAEADRLVAELRRDLARVEHDLYGGQFPEALAQVVADGVALCQEHVRNHERLAALGWDPLEYLRGQAELTLRLARGKTSRI